MIPRAEVPSSSRSAIFSSSSSAFSKLGLAFADDFFSTAHLSLHCIYRFPIEPSATITPIDSPGLIVFTVLMTRPRATVTRE
jgi:hypothetical protein